MRFDLILFDFDETLIRSKPTYYAAYRHALATRFGDEIEEELFHELWSHAITPQQAFARLSEHHAHDLMEAFEVYYYNNHHLTLSPYPDIIEMLTKLRMANLKLGVISLKPRRAGDKEIDICGLRQFFDLIIWGDDVAHPKPAPDACLKAIHHFHISPARTLICGDSVVDIKMGRAAKICTAAALWGSANRQALIAAQPDLLFEHPSEIALALSTDKIKS